MHEHRNREIPLGKHARDHVQMRPDGLLALCIFRVQRLDLDATAIREKIKMMAREFMTEAHSLVAPLVHSLSVLGVSAVVMTRTRRRLLGPGAKQKRGGKQQDRK